MVVALSGEPRALGALVVAVLRQLGDWRWLMSWSKT